jgi:hypothetical protein
MPTNITGLIDAKYAQTFINTRTKNAVAKLYANVFIQKFIKNDKSFNADLDRPFTKGEIANITVRPVMTDAVASTNITDLVTYENNSYGTIPVTLDYIIPKAWSYRDINSAISEQDIENDNFLAAADAISRGYERQVITRMRTSSFIPAGQVLGTSATALNAAVFRKLRTAATKYGIPSSQYINVVIDADFFEQLIAIPQFENAKGLSVASVAEGGNDVTGEILEVGGFYKMRFFSSNYYTRPFPASDPVATAFIDDCFVTPFRQLQLTDSVNQAVVNYKGLSMLFTKSYDASNVGGLTVRAKLEVLFGAKEYSGDINSAGVLQTVPIWNIKGGI